MAVDPNIQKIVDKKKRGETLTPVEEGQLNGYRRTLEDKRINNRLSADETVLLNDTIVWTFGATSVTGSARTNQTVDMGTGTIRVEQVPEAPKPITKVTENKEGVKTVTSALNEDDARKAQENLSRAPAAITETMRVTGVPGQINLTQGGRLNSDKSVREDRKLEQINEELNLKSGPNPIPNRDGNERLKAELGFRPDSLIAIDLNTNAMADDLKQMRESGNIDNARLEQMEQQLRATGRSA